MLSELKLNGVAQLILLDDEASLPGSDVLMSLMDKMDHSGS